MAPVITKKSPHADAREEATKTSGREIRKKTGKKRPEPGSSTDHYEFRLYVTGNTPRSRNAIANLKRICEEYLGGECDIQVINLLESPQLARQDNIVAIPTLIKDLPAPVWIMIGDLSNLERILEKLGFSVSGDPSKPESSR
ncbi:MAG: circadian clock KaiB family protein [Candidatus Latescibacterota bacterium]